MREFVFFVCDTPNSALYTRHSIECDHFAEAVDLLQEHILKEQKRRLHRLQEYTVVYVGEKSIRYAVECNLFLRPID